MIPQNNQRTTAEARREVIEQLQATGAKERAAAVRHINGFLQANDSPQVKQFWQSVRDEILADGKE